MLPRATGGSGPFLFPQEPVGCQCLCGAATGPPGPSSIPTFSTPLARPCAWWVSGSHSPLSSWVFSLWGRHVGSSGRKEFPRQGRVGCGLCALPGTPQTSTSFVHLSTRSRREGPSGAVVINDQQVGCDTHEARGRSREGGSERSKNRVMATAKRQDPLARSFLFCHTIRLQNDLF